MIVDVRAKEYLALKAAAKISARRTAPPASAAGGRRAPVSTLPQTVAISLSLTCAAHFTLSPRAVRLYTV
jgi:hypothetical protein